jgi:ribosomal protein S18 acetylase RimI-like enzyme
MYQEVPAGDERTSARLLDRGFAITRHILHMLIDLDGPPKPPAWPDEVELRPFIWAEHGRLVSDAENEVFRDHWGFAPMSDDDAFDRLQHWYENDPDVDPTLWFIAWSGDSIAGFALCWPKCDDDPDRGYVAGLGVRRPWRGKGLGLALLRHSFRELHQRGRKQAALDVDAENITGAVRLYTKAGMHIHRQVDNYEKELRAGEDLALGEILE